MLERTLYKYREFGLFILRMVIGVIFVVHGYNKIFEGEGVSGTARLLSTVGIYMPGLVAWFVSLGEFVGGVLILIGFLTRECALFLAIIMLGAIWTVHYPNGFFATDKGYEYNLALIGACLCLMFSGGGSGALDKIIFPRARWTFISDPSKVRLEPPENIMD